MSHPVTHRMDPPTATCDCVRVRVCVRTREPRGAALVALEGRATRALHAHSKTLRSRERPLLLVAPRCYTRRDGAAGTSSPPYPPLHTHTHTHSHLVQHVHDALAQLRRCGAHLPRMRGVRTGGARGSAHLVHNPAVRQGLREPVNGGQPVLELAWRACVRAARRPHTTDAARYSARTRGARTRLRGPHSLHGAAHVCNKRVRVHLRAPGARRGHGSQRTLLLAPRAAPTQTARTEARTLFANVTQNWSAVGLCVARTTTTHAHRLHAAAAARAACLHDVDVPAGLLHAVADGVHRNLCEWGQSASAAGVPRRGRERPRRHSLPSVEMKQTTLKSVLPRICSPGIAATPDNSRVRRARSSATHTDTWKRTATATSKHANIVLDRENTTPSRRHESGHRHRARTHPPPFSSPQSARTARRRRSCDRAKRSRSRPQALTTWRAGTHPLRPMYSIVAHAPARGLSSPPAVRARTRGQRTRNKCARARAGHSRAHVDAAGPIGGHKVLVLRSHGAQSAPPPQHTHTHAYNMFTQPSPAAAPCSGTSP